MKKTIILLSFVFSAIMANGQETLINHSDKEFFKDTISFELKDQLPDSYYKVFLDPAKTVIEYKGKIESFKRTGEWWWYHSNGAKSRIVNYFNGQIAGIDRSYYENGQISLEVNYNNGLQNGPTKGWYLTGIIMFEGSYINGTPSGTWKFYNQDGSLYREEQH